MGIIKDIEKHCELALNAVKKADDIKKDEIAWTEFYKDFKYRFCWSSNSLEGNTLSLDDTIAVIDYDEVRSNHTYSEYSEAKCMYNAIKNLNVSGQEITETWIKENNGIIIDSVGEYRTKNIYIGSVIEAKFYPPNYTKVASLMKEYMDSIKNGLQGNFKQKIESAAVSHITFERIHPFIDGNGRVGRLLLNQLLLNEGLFPISISNTSKYRQALQAYDNTKDTSLMEYLICDGQKEASERLLQFEIKIKEVEEDLER